MRILRWGCKRDAAANPPIPASDAWALVRSQAPDRNVLGHHCSGEDCPATTPRESHTMIGAAVAARTSVPGLPNVILVGAPRAGTTSLFSYLSQHSEIGASKHKETNYFRGVPYGRPLPPRQQYSRQFDHCLDEPVRLEATPVYFFGGDAMLDAIEATLGSQVQFLVLLREPVSRTVSFFNFMKSRQLLPPELSLREYVDRCLQLTPDDHDDPEKAPWLGVARSTYAAYLPPWLERAGERLRVLFFEDLKSRPRDLLSEVFEFVGVDSSFAGEVDVAVENRAMGFRNAALQRFALRVNALGEPLWRRHSALTAIRRGARHLYYSVNGRAASGEHDPTVLAELETHFRSANALLAEQLRGAGYAWLPEWLDAEPTGSAGQRPHPAGIRLHR